MRHLAAVAALASLFVLAPAKANATSRQVDEILAQVIPEGATAMSIAPSTAPASIPAFTTLLVSTGSVSTTAALAFPARATRSAHLLTNECANAVRVGPASITSSVGQFVAAGATVNLDSVVGPYRGALYIVATTGTCAWSGSEVLP